VHAHAGVSEDRPRTTHARCQTGHSSKTALNLAYPSLQTQGRSLQQHARRAQTQRALAAPGCRETKFSPPDNVILLSKNMVSFSPNVLLCTGHFFPESLQTHLSTVDCITEV